jgi:hypothetical protein
MLHAILKKEFGKELPADDMERVLRAIRETGYRRLLFGFAVVQLIAEAMPDFASDNLILDCDDGVIR